MRDHSIHNMYFMALLGGSLNGIIFSLRYGDIRLVGGAYQMQGRLEIYYNRQWGTVCNDTFGYSEAMVICRQLGSSSRNNVRFYTSGDGTGIIWLDDLSCSGSEDKIADCSHRPWGANDCSHSQDIGVWCFDASEGDLRLVGGSIRGRLEIFHRNTWGTICVDGFDGNDAKVACHQLNLATSNAQYYTHGNGKEPIWLDRLACTGTETSIDNCKRLYAWAQHYCSHSKDVGIRCYGSKQPRQGDLRLVGGVGPRDGRLEVYYSSQWGTICDDGFGLKKARVACRQLRLSTDDAEYFTTRGLSSQQINLDNVNCTGQEARIDQCSHNGWRNDDCSHSEDVGIKCYGNYVVNGNWGQWSAWNTCSVTCNGGTQRRKRYCNSPRPSAIGLTCSGSSYQYQSCQIRECHIVNGNWGQWISWNACSTTCNNGTQRRNRYCNNPAPSTNGHRCSDNSYQIKHCFIKGCPVDGHWSRWTHWESCSLSCGNGQRKRSRYCDNPVPLNHGRNCHGSADEFQSCFIQACPINGGWSSWSEWTHCNTTCDGGIQSRNRSCDTPEPASNGIYCIGNDTDYHNCNTAGCQDFLISGEDQSKYTVTYVTLAGVASACVVLTLVIFVAVPYIIQRIRLSRGCNKNQSRTAECRRSAPNEYISSEVAPWGRVGPNENYEEVDLPDFHNATYGTDDIESTSSDIKRLRQQSEIYENLKM